MVPVPHFIMVLPTKNITLYYKVLAIKGLVYNINVSNEKFRFLHTLQE